MAFELSGADDLGQPPRLVWAALFDPATLQACIPGCELVEQENEAAYRAVVVLKIGPIKARFTGAVTIVDRTEGERCTIVGKGDGGVAGFASGDARISFQPSAGGGTHMTYVVTANVGGKLAALGMRLIDGTARKLAAQFFANLSARLADAEPNESAIATSA